MGFWGIQLSAHAAADTGEWVDLRSLSMGVSSTVTRSLCAALAPHIAQKQQLARTLEWCEEKQRSPRIASSASQSAVFKDATSPATSLASRARQMTGYDASSAA